MIIYKPLCHIIKTYLRSKSEFIKDPYIIDRTGDKYNWPGKHNLFPTPDYFILPNVITAVKADDYCIIYRDNHKENVGLAAERSFIICIPMFEANTNKHDGVFLVIYSDNLTIEVTDGNIKVKGESAFMVYHKDLGRQYKVLEELMETDENFLDRPVYVIIDGLWTIDRLGTGK